LQRQRPRASRHNLAVKICPPALLAAVCLSLILISPAAIAFESISNANAVQLTTYVGQPLSIFSPYPSNLTQISVAGNSYDLQRQQVSYLVSVPGVSASALVHPRVTGDEILFTPGNVSSYTLWANLTSTGPTYVLVSNGSVNGGNLLRNVTLATPNRLEFAISVLASPPQSGGWNPLFGFTGLSLGSLNITVGEAFAVLGALAAVMVGIGARFSRRLMWLGVLFALGIATAVAGVLVVVLAVSLYLGSFVAVRYYFSLRGRSAAHQGTDAH
jgi:hypothetical protein